MVTILRASAVIWLAIAILSFTFARGAMHEILALLAASFGIVFLALAAILARMDKGPGEVRVTG